MRLLLIVLCKYPYLLTYLNPRAILYALKCSSNGKNHSIHCCQVWQMLYMLYRQECAFFFMKMVFWKTTTAVCIGGQSVKAGSFRSTTWKINTWKNVSPWSQILWSYCAEFGISSEVTPGEIFNQKGRPRTLSTLAKINKMPASQKLTYNILKVTGSKTLDQGSPSPSFVFHQF